MKRAYVEMVTEVEINWSPPKLYDNALMTPVERLSDVYFYKITGRYKGKYKLLYIGKTYRQFANHRLLNRDHQKRRESLQKAHKRHDLLISFGHLAYINRQLNARLIGDVEKLLIYSHSNLDHPHLANRSNTWTHSISKDYLIINTGFRAAGMVKEIGLGLFYKY